MKLVLSNTLPTLFLLGVGYLHQGVTGQSACPYDPMNDPAGMMTWLGENCMAEDAETGLSNPCCFIQPPLTRITAEQAYDAYQDQAIDGNSGVLLVDVRAPDELYWTGQVAQVTSINFKDSAEAPLEPDHFKTILDVHTLSLTDTPIPGRLRRLAAERATGKVQELFGADLVTSNGEVIDVEAVASLTLSPIAYNIPVETRDPSANFEVSLNTNFGADIMELISSMGQMTPQAIIFYCRSGRRSSVGCYYGYCSEFMTIPPGMFTFYEVEAVDANGNEINGRGGFEGASYGNRFNGYRGFPSRPGVSDAVDFKDAGLPIVIGHRPVTVDAPIEQKPWACKDPAKQSLLGVCQ